MIPGDDFDATQEEEGSKDIFKIEFSPEAENMSAQDSRAWIFGVIFKEHPTMELDEVFRMVERVEAFIKKAGQ